MPATKVPHRAHYEGVDPQTYRHRHLDRYESHMIDVRRSYILGLGRHGLIVDLGCGPGEYLRIAVDAGLSAVGIDFSGRVLAAEARLSGAPVIQADVSQIPLASACAGLAVSYSTLYHVPRLRDAIQEVGRILRGGGHAVLELGNRRSLNAIVMRDQPVQSSLLTPTEMDDLLSAAGLTVVQRRCFQLLPMWGGRIWLRPLVTPKWRGVMSMSIRGKMLDEWLSSAVPQIAFRHLLVCEKR